MVETARTVVVGRRRHVCGGRGPATIAEQFEAAERLATQVAELATRLASRLTHGNGPQVGFILRRSDLVAEIAPELPQLALDMCVADSQAVGLHPGQLTAECADDSRADPAGRRSADATVVDAADPAFLKPHEAIGSFTTEQKARELASEHGWTVTEDSGRGGVDWSPHHYRPGSWRTRHQTLAQSGFSSSCGRWRDPVVEAPRAAARVEAVIEQGLRVRPAGVGVGRRTCCASPRVSEQVAINFGKPDQRALGLIDIDEARQHLADGQFPPGSMGPKIEAALQYLEAGGKEVLITSPDRLAEALDGSTGTRVVAASPAE